MRLRLAAVLLLIVGAASAQDALILLKQVEAAYRNLQSYHFEATIDVTIKSDVRQTHEKHVFTAAAVKPGKWRAEVKEPGNWILTVSDGVRMWSYRPWIREYAVLDGAPSADSTDRALVFARRQFETYEGIVSAIKTARIIRTERIATTECYVVEVGLATPEGASMTLWIASGNYLVLRMHVRSRSESPDGSFVERDERHEYQTAKVNIQIPDALFSWSPPAEARKVAELDPFGYRTRELRANTGRKAKDFTLTGLDGETYSLESFKGNWLLLSFWATWCPPCREQMSILDSISRSNLRVLAVTDENADAVRAYLRANGYQLSAALDKRDEAARAYEVSAVPTLFLIDPEGKIHAQYTGFRTAGFLTDELARAEIR